MEEEQKRTDIFDNVYVGNGEEISTKEIQEISNVADKEYEKVPKGLENEGGI